MKNLGRVLTAMITPFHQDGTVDYEGAVILGKYLLNHGSDGLVICGTTGEGATINDEEKLKLFKIMSEKCGHLGTIIANTGSNDTMRSVALTKEATKAGVHGIMTVVPYYNKPNQEGIYRHFKAIAESTELPIILYNVPGRTSSHVTPQVVLRLAKEFSNVIAIKDATGDLTETAELSRIRPEGFMIYSGDDALTLPMLSLGAYGVISVSSHLVGREMKKMIESFEKGNWKEAMDIHLYLMPLFRAMFITTNPIPVKTAVAIMKLPAGPFHLPLVDANPEQTMQIKTFVEQYVKE